MRKGGGARVIYDDLRRVNNRQQLTSRLCRGSTQFGSVAVLWLRDPFLLLVNQHRSARLAIIRLEPI